MQAMESKFSESLMKVMSDLSMYFCPMNLPTGNNKRRFSSSMMAMESLNF